MPTINVYVVELIQEKPRNLSDIHSFCVSLFMCVHEILTYYRGRPEMSN